MYQSGQHSHSLFPGVNSDNLKTFVLEVDCYHLEDALKAMEKVIQELKLSQSYFGYGSKTGVRTAIRYS
ncbi:TPA: hypothetical protein ACGE20_004826 [Salmonella enterica subsp. enterica]|uniref:Uncharacterized protein n=12 Tax=Salmonella enterica TaxID=28901 RepID=A0A5T7ZZI9_SALNE|nr:hypothetical protein [Salmonella enterica]EAB6120632.1 hypothetical protein [Salmonella enterica subsp. enterica serovar Braenderup]EAC0780104.1 hypothetical protein [Salmonella enterica subsp. enterica serovar Aba]EAC1193079.1 hypothetical protein [Salmonella enterica subsp. enterica serovar Heidelberg]EBF9808779.1 hypothetical protein [Salmonella enterica subsp. enterica serovar Litchfield]EBH8124776.1 hypothetical protein [Salmonella enterica subsp. enterica serovar Typhimurium str. UK-1